MFFQIAALCIRTLKNLKKNYEIPVKLCQKPENNLKKNILKSAGNPEVVPVNEFFSAN